MATHSGILAWSIPWTEDPGRLQSKGSQESDMTYQLNHHTPTLQVDSLMFESPGYSGDPELGNFVTNTRVTKRGREVKTLYIFKGVHPKIIVNNYHKQMKP